MNLSIVTTLYQSGPYVEEFVRRITVQARAITDDYEIILVDDGSPDNSLEIALRSAQNDPHLRVVELSRNFGHHPAMMTGLDFARGDLVFLIDSDLEEPPELLGAFHDTLRQSEGQLDVIYGYQEERQGGWLKRFGGFLAWKLLQLLLPIRVPHNHSTVRLMTRTYVQSLVSHRERKMAIGGLWVITGFHQHGVPFRKVSRKTTSYTPLRRARMLLDSVTSFSEVPLIMVLYLGVFLLFTSGAFALYLVARRLRGFIHEGWTSVMVSVWFFGGTVVFCIGILGLYISRIFIETKNRPYTIVRRVHERTGPP